MSASTPASLTRDRVSVRSRRFGPDLGVDGALQGEKVPYGVLDEVAAGPLVRAAHGTRRGSRMREPPHAEGPEHDQADPEHG